MSLANVIRLPSNDFSLFCKGLNVPPPALPPNENERLESLKALHLLDTPLEERFDRITRLAKKALNAPIVVISLVDKDRQWFKSVHGLEETETPRTVSFCGHAILRDETMIVTDATTDRRVFDSPLVTGPPHIRFYMGQPIRSQQNLNIGVLCVLDTQPRNITPDEIDALRDLAFLVERELKHENADLAQRNLILQLDEAKRKALVDPLTRLWNRDGITLTLNRRVQFSKSAEKPFVVAMLDLDHFKKVNDTYGHPAGDRILIEVARRLRACAREFDAVGRFGGEEFILVMPEVDSNLGEKVCSRFLEAIGKNYFEIEANRFPIQASIGFAVCGPANAWNLEETIQAADKALYEAKAMGRNQVRRG